MGKSSTTRNLALQRAKNADTPQGVIDALLEHGTKRQQAIARNMQLQLSEMSAKVIEDLKAQEASNDFAKQVMQR